MSDIVEIPSELVEIVYIPNIIRLYIHVEKHEEEYLEKYIEKYVEKYKYVKDIKRNLHNIYQKYFLSHLFFIDEKKKLYEKRFLKLTNEGLLFMKDNLSNIDYTDLLEIMNIYYSIEKRLFIESSPDFNAKYLHDVRFNFNIPNFINDKFYIPNFFERLIQDIMSFPSAYREEVDMCLIIKIHNIYNLLNLNELDHMFDTLPVNECLENIKDHINNHFYHYSIETIATKNLNFDIFIQYLHVFLFRPNDENNLQDKGGLIHHKICNKTFIGK